MRNVIVGGGAAGIFAAVWCQQDTLLLEKTNQLLAKVRISGGGRCNVTHACFDPHTLIQSYPRGSKELLGPFHRFQPKDTIAWFEEHGVFLKTEEDGRVFPTTDSSETIIRCLIDNVKCEIRKQQKINSIQKIGNQFHLQLEDQTVQADHLLLATGSSAWGYEIAKQFGHHIIEPVPSLFTFNIPTSPLLELAGISVPHVILTLKEIHLSQQGPLLLTHWGFSGPAVLKLSAWAARDMHRLHYKATLLINWTAAHSPEELYQTVFQTKKKPLSSKLFAQLSAPFGKNFPQLAAKLYTDPYLIEGKTTYKQEFVTAGGIDLKEVNFKTMESRITPGLFFAGEILNIDGITGGFNFQNAWTTAYLAAMAMEKE